MTTGVSPYPGVLVGTDGSPTAAAAVVAASRLAVAAGAPLTVVTAWYRDLEDRPPPSEESRYPGGSAAGQEARWASNTVTDAIGLARSHGVEDVSQVTPVGNPAEQLLELSSRNPGTLTVVGTVGLAQRAERLVGNVPHQLTHHCPGDLFLVASTEPHENGWQRVALATDGSKTAATACLRGHQLASALGATATLVSVAASEKHAKMALDRTADDLGDAEIEREAVVANGDVARALADAAASFDLLVVGNKGMSGPSRLLGSVSNRLTHEIPTDILLVNSVAPR